ncbi:unnamed protein product [Blepharisma stoltei]|uniref:Cyclic nucleotide-binding domain-containing protein n=1 Tax=Blepharisma stoltei TaxID=1481888 RepID=A0AAU9J4K3_9CILI|nr:unnamed protein product [Blepharisma stoltei]
MEFNNIFSFKIIKNSIHFNMEESDALSDSSFQEADTNLSKNQNFWNFCCKKSQIDNSEEARIERACERWRKVIRFRGIVSSINIVKQQTKDAENDYYHGSTSEVKDSGKIKKKSWIIYSGSKRKKVFDFLLSFVYLYFCFEGPYRVFFYSDDDNENPIDYDLALDAIVFVDIILRFFTAYKSGAVVVDDHKRIAKKYIKGLFLIDILSTIPFYLATHWLMWLKLGRIFRIGSITTWIEKSTARTENDNGWLTLNFALRTQVTRILKFLLYLSCICHYIACIWYFIAKSESDDLTKTWIKENGLNRNQLYETSLYFTLVVFSTTGYGDYYPRTYAETVFMMIVQILGILMYAYFIGNVSSLIASLKSNEDSIHQKEHQLDKWLFLLGKNKNQKNISPDMQNTVRKYFSFIWKYDNSAIVRDSEFMMRLPYKLRKALIKHLFTGDVKRYEAFFYGCPEEFCYHMALNMYPRRYESMEEIIYANTAVSEVYFIHSGTILLGTLHGVQLFLKLSPRSYFGDEYIIFKSKPRMSYLADMNGCELLCVSKDIFEKFLKKYPQAFTVLSRRAYKRGLYFNAIMSAETKKRDSFVIQSESDQDNGDIFQKMKRSGTSVLTNFDENFDSLNDEEMQGMRDALNDIELLENGPKNKVIEKMEDSIQQLKDLKIEMDELNESLKLLEDDYEAKIEALSGS